MNLVDSENAIPRCENSIYRARKTLISQNLLRVNQVIQQIKMKGLELEYLQNAIK